MCAPPRSENYYLVITNPTNCAHGGLAILGIAILVAKKRQGAERVKGCLY